MTATTTVTEKALKNQDDFNEEISANKNDAIFDYQALDTKFLLTLMVLVQ